MLGNVLSLIGYVTWQKDGLQGPNPKLNYDGFTIHEMPKIAGPVRRGWMDIISYKTHSLVSSTERKGVYNCAVATLTWSNMIQPTSRCTDGL